jgi:hypothetical protein
VNTAATTPQTKGEEEMLGKRILIAACLTLGFAGCGGGDDSPALPTTPTTPPANLQINGTNYLDAFAVSSLGAVRILLIADAIDSAFEAVIDSNDVPGTYPCAAGGTLTLTKNGTARTLTVNNCNDGFVLYVSGSLTSPNAVAQTFGSVTLLLSGDFTMSNVVYRILDDTVTETINGAVNVQRRADLSITATGAFSALRNGRADNYGNITGQSTIPDASGAVDVANFSFSVNSPRFTAQPLSVTIGSSGGVVTAPDTSNVTATDASSGTTLALRFDVRSAPGATPSVTQTLTENDPQVLAAFERALQ